MAKKEKEKKEAEKHFSKAPAAKTGSEETTTVHVSEERKGKAFPARMILIYVLLLAAGVFIGIVVRLAFR